MHLRRDVLRETARAFAWGGSALFAVAAAGACLLDDNRCGKNQVEHLEEGSFAYCECASNAVPDVRGYDCVLCGPNETVKGAACACNAGFVRPSPGAACVEGTLPDAGVGDAGSGSGPTGLGLPCETAADCVTYQATFCPPVGDTKVCMIEGCAAAEVTCPAEYTCCEIEAVSNTLCIPSSLVPAGVCPFGGTVVPE